MRINYINENSNPTKIENTDWGTVYYYSAPNYRYCIYTYNDDQETGYLSNVRVNKNSRGQGLGNQILINAEENIKKLGMKLIILKVKNTNTFAYDWYKRHGYRELESEHEYTWMKKDLE